MATKTCNYCNQPKPLTQFRLLANKCWDCSNVSLPAAKRVAECHPGREHVARGLCSACYKKAWREQDKEVRSYRLSIRLNAGGIDARL